MLRKIPTFMISLAAVAALGASVLVAATNSYACGPAIIHKQTSKPASSAEILEFQLRNIDKILKYERLSGEKRATIMLLRTEFEKLQSASKRAEARKILSKIYGMLNLEEHFSIFGPPTALCGPQPLNRGPHTS